MLTHSDEPVEYTGILGKYNDEGTSSESDDSGSDDNGTDGGDEGGMLCCDYVSRPDKLLYV